MKTLALVAMLAAAALAGCGGDGAPAGDPPTVTEPQASGLGGPAISIDEALASGSDEMLLVTGSLLADEDQVRLCSALAESFPPQCAGSSLVVEGLKLEEVDGLETAGGVSWGTIELLGVVRDGTLTVSENVEE